MQQQADLCVDDVPNIGRKCQLGLGSKMRVAEFIPRFVHSVRGMRYVFAALQTATH